MNDIIDCLYTTSGSYAKNKLLNRLRKNMSNIAMLTQEIGNDSVTNIIKPGADRTSTLEELSN